MECPNSLLEALVEMPLERSKNQNDRLTLGTNCYQEFPLLKGWTFKKSNLGKLNFGEKIITFENQHIWKVELLKSQAFDKLHF